MAEDNTQVGAWASPSRHPFPGHFSYPVSVMAWWVKASWQWGYWWGDFLLCQWYCGLMNEASYKGTDSKVRCPTLGVQRQGVWPREQQGLLFLQMVRWSCTNNCSTRHHSKAQHHEGWQQMAAQGYVTFPANERAERALLTPSLLVGQHLLLILVSFCDIMFT